MYHDEAGPTASVGTTQMFGSWQREELEGLQEVKHAGDIGWTKAMSVRGLASASRLELGRWIR